MIAGQFAPTPDGEVEIGNLEPGAWYMVCWKIAFKDSGGTRRGAEQWCHNDIRTRKANGELLPSPINVHDVWIEGSDVVANTTINTDAKMNISVSVSGKIKRKIVEKSGFRIIRFANLSMAPGVQEICQSWSPVGVLRTSEEPLDITVRYCYDQEVSEREHLGEKGQEGGGTGDTNGGGEGSGVGAVPSVVAATIVFALRLQY